MSLFWSVRRAQQNILKKKTPYQEGCLNFSASSKCPLHIDGFCKILIFRENIRDVNNTICFSPSNNGIFNP